MKLIFLFIISLTIRLIIIFFSKNIKNYDLQSYFLIGEKTFKGTNIYPQFALNHYPYLPLFLYLEALAFFLRHYLNPTVFLKLVINFFDLANGYLIYCISNKNFKNTVIYLLNPISILIFSFHGQFDALPLFFLMLTIFLLNKKKFLIGVVAYSIAIAFKTWPIFFIFIIFDTIRNYFYIIVLFSVLMTITLVYSILFKVNPLLIFFTILNYRSLFSEWGLGRLIKTLFYHNQPQPPIYLQKFFLILFLLIFFNYSIFLVKKSYKIIFKKIFHLIIFFYVFTVGFSIQYLSWIIPFLLILKFKEILITIILIFIYLSIHYLTWIRQSQLILIVKDLLGIFLWFYFFLLWLLKNKELSKGTKS